MKIFSNYFVSKMILLNILKNITIYLFIYFISLITVIPQKNLFLYYKKIQFPKENVLHDFTKYFSGARELENKSLSG